MTKMKRGRLLYAYLKDYFRTVCLIINRTIFRWLTAKNFHALEFDTKQPTPPEKLLAAFKSGTGSYARAFEYMARYDTFMILKIQCHKVVVFGVILLSS